MATRLLEILNKEGITKAELGRQKGLNPTTVHYLCKDSEYFKNRKELTLHNVVRAINELSSSKKSYELKEVFPN